MNKDRILLPPALGRPNWSDKGIREKNVKDWIRPVKADPIRIITDCSGASLMNFSGVLNKYVFPN